nr:hypothetical protein [Candidatus Sigynarchaeota archaeon]
MWEWHECEQFPSWSEDVSSPSTVIPYNIYTPGRSCLVVIFMGSDVLQNDSAREYFDKLVWRVTASKEGQGVLALAMLKTLYAGNAKAQPPTTVRRTRGHAGYWNERGIPSWNARVNVAGRPMIKLGIKTR